MIYLDNAATSPILPEVLDSMIPYLTENFGNPGSLYPLGIESYKAVKTARAEVAEMINCKPEQIIFTSGGSEANNLAIRGVAKCLELRGKNKIITSEIEHESLLRAVISVCNEHNFEVARVPVSTETLQVDMGEIEKEISPETGLISIMLTNNETGVENDVAKIRELCAGKNILIHTDCVQAAGYSDLDVTKLGCDMLSISGHKIGAPKGIGALFVKDRSTIEPMIFGGGAQEFGLRGGTENVASIVGLGEACALCAKNRENNVRFIEKYKSIFLKTLKDCFEDENSFHINSNSGKVISIRFKGVDAQTLVIYLGAKGVCISSGSACNSHESNPSHVLKAIGLTDEEASSSVRISFNQVNTEEDVESAAKIIADSVKELRHIKKNG